MVATTDGKAARLAELSGQAQTVALVGVPVTV
jgi:hypothetical protein